MKRNLISKLARSTALTALVVCQLAPPALAQSENIEISPADVATAEAHAALAYAAYVDEEYEAAVRLYLQAYEAAPSPDILYNIARIYDVRLGDHANAIKFYRDVVSDPSAEPRRVALASARLHELTGGAEAATLAPAASSAAPLEDAAPASPPAHSDAPAVTMAPSVEGSLHAESSPHPPSWSAWRRGAIMTGSVGLVAVGFGAVFGAKALSQAKTVRQECEGELCSSERGLSAARSATRNADIATLSFVAGGLLLATGATLLGIDLGASHEPDRPATARWTAAVTGTDVRLEISGRW